MHRPDLAKLMASVMSASTSKANAASKAFEAEARNVLTEAERTMQAIVEDHDAKMSVYH